MIEKRKDMTEYRKAQIFFGYIFVNNSSAQLVR